MTKIEASKDGTLYETIYNDVLNGLKVDGYAIDLSKVLFDKDGVRMLYPTDPEGDTWYVNKENPKSDLRVRNVSDTTFNHVDGLIEVTDNDCRIEVLTASGRNWKPNVEMTAYLRMGAGSKLFQMYNRGGHHSDRTPCIGTALKARLYGNGRTSFVKEVGHPAYTVNRSVVDKFGEVSYRLVGFKAVFINQPDGVLMQSFVDYDCNNKWTPASTVKDSGGWSAAGDSDFAKMANCTYNGHRLRADEILVNGGQICAFRTDDLVWRFKSLSIREIIV